MRLPDLPPDKVLNENPLQNLAICRFHSSMGAQKQRTNRNGTQLDKMSLSNLIHPEQQPHTEMPVRYSLPWTGKKGAVSRGYDLKLCYNLNCPRISFLLILPTLVLGIS